jgi:hypothetical protein
MTVDVHVILNQRYEDERSQNNETLLPYCCPDQRDEPVIQVSKMDLRLKDLSNLGDLFIPI